MSGRCYPPTTPGCPAPERTRRMASAHNAVMAALDRWVAAGLIDADTGALGVVFALTFPGGLLFCVSSRIGRAE